MKIKKIDTFIIYIVIPLFLIGLAFLGRTYEIIYAFFILLTLSDRKTKITKTSFLLLILGLCFVFFSFINYDNNIFEAVFKCLVYWVFYQIGAIVCRKYVNKEFCLDRLVFYVLFAFGTGSFLRYALDVMQSWTKVLNHHRWILDIWTHTETTATIGGGWCIPLSCFFYYVVSSNRFSFFIKLIVYIEVAVALFFNILTGTRNFLIIFTITTLIAFVFNELIGHKDRKKLVRVTGILLLLVIIIFALYSSNSFGIKDYIQKSTLLMRLNKGELSSHSMNDNGRIERYIFILNNLKTVFWGGSHCEAIGKRIHNWFLQCLDIYGFLAMILLIVVFVRVVMTYYSYIKSRRVDESTRVLILSIIVTFTLYGMIEPILTSNNIVISLLFLVAGILDIYKKDGVKKHERNKGVH